MLVAECAPETSLVNNPSNNGKCLNNITPHHYLPSQIQKV